MVSNFGKIIVLMGLFLDAPFHSQCMLVAAILATGMVAFACKS